MFMLAFFPSRDKRAQYVGVALIACLSCAGREKPTPPSDEGDLPRQVPHEAPSQACLPEPAPLLKLTARQYRNTLRDLLQSTGAANAWPAVEEALVGLPPDTHDGFRQLDRRVAQNHVDTYYRVARVISASVEANDAASKALGGDCSLAATPERTCIAGVLVGFGQRVLRRPLSDAEISLYTEAALEEPTAKQALSATVFNLLMSPGFLYHMELEGEARAENPGLVRLSAHALASRLSYLLWESMPDDELLAAAQSGSLMTAAGYKEQVDRLFADPRARATIRDFYTQWWKLEGFSGFSNSEVFAAFSAPVNLAAKGEAPHKAMIDEVHAIADHFTWQQAGTLSQALSTDQTFSTSSVLAQIYGVQAWDGRGVAPSLPNRAGLLTRAAFLVSGDHKTSPFHRGAFIRRHLLCDEIPEPDPASLPPGSLEPPAHNIGLTTRERFAAKTNSADCMGCHVAFNDLGFMLEPYDALGRHRTNETVYDENAKVVASLPINAKAKPRLEDGDESSMDGPLELVNAIVESGKANSCFAQQYFRFVFRRIESSSDGCTLSAIEKALSGHGGSLQNALRQAVFDPAFQWKGVPKP